MAMVRCVPALPVLDVDRSTRFFADRLSFAVRRQAEDVAILVRDAAEIHLWAANRPDVPGAEPHLAGTASCRVEVDALDALFAEYRRADALETGDEPVATPWGTTEFTVFDPDRNCVTFFQAVG